VCRYGLDAAHDSGKMSKAFSDLEDRMIKTELQVALAAATETNKRTTGVLLETLSNLVYNEIKKNGEFVLPTPNA
jgi:hypothetical protein